MTMAQSISYDSFALLRAALADDATMEDRERLSISLRTELSEAEASLDRIVGQVKEGTGANVRLDVLFHAATRYGAALAVTTLITKIADTSASPEWVA